jgi:Acyltransferase family
MPEVRTSAVVAPHTVTAGVASRAGWMDSLRVVVIAGVIILHAATAYILDIDWYYQERTTSTLTPTLLAFPALLAGLFGLGPLFLLGGLLSARSLGRKGSGRFVRGRLVRLGLPLLGFVVLVDRSPTTSAPLPRANALGSGPTWSTRPGPGTLGRCGSWCCCWPEPGLCGAAAAASRPGRRCGRCRPPVPDHCGRRHRRRVLRRPDLVAVGRRHLRQPPLGGLAPGGRSVRPRCARR